MCVIFCAEKCNKHKVTSDNLIQLIAQMTTNNYFFILFAPTSFSPYRMDEIFYS